MATFLVLRKVKEDWESLPGELLVDPDPTVREVLLSRGYITPVPDNYPGTVSRNPEETEVAPVASTPTEKTEDPASVPADSPPPSDEPLEGQYEAELDKPAHVSGEYVADEDKTPDEALDSDEDEPSDEDEDEPERAPEPLMPSRPVAQAPLTPTRPVAQVTRRPRVGK